MTPGRLQAAPEPVATPNRAARRARARERRSSTRTAPARGDPARPRLLDLTRRRVGVTTRQPSRVTGPAQRQAFDRAVSLGRKLTPGDHKALNGVVYYTTSYGKLGDWVRHDRLAETIGVSVRNLRRSLGRLSRHGIIVYEPGNGRGRLSWIEIPAVPVERRTKGGQNETAKADKTDAERRTKPASSHGRDLYRGPEKVSTEKITLSERERAIREALVEATHSNPSDKRVDVALPDLLDLVEELSTEDAVAEIQSRAKQLAEIYSDPAYLVPTSLVRDWRRAAPPSASSTPSRSTAGTKKCSARTTTKGR